MATKPILEAVPRIKARSDADASGARPAAQLWSFLARAAVKRLLLLAADAASLVASHHVAEVILQRSMHLSASFLNPGYYYFFYVPFFAALLYLFGGYKSPDLRRPENELELIFKGASFSFVALACANFILFKSLGFSRYLLVVWYLLALMFLLVARFALRAFYNALWKRGLARHTALLMGGLDRLAAFERRLAMQRYRAFSIAGALIEPGERPVPSRAELSLRVLGSIADWEEVARRVGARLVVIHFADSSAAGHARVLAIVRRCRQQGIDVEVYSHLFDPPDLRFERDDFSGCCRLQSQPHWPRTVERLVKGALDVAIGLLGSLATLALMPFVGLVLKLEDGGPVFHRREYVGMDGRVHHFLKFRTMVCNAEEILASDTSLRARFESNFKLKDDPRVLRCGRFLRKYSLDEFPQFFSILAGRITAVGPRAITPAARLRYGDRAPRLLSMKPGLTGFWQVMGRQTTTFEEKVQMDMFYIEHWSIWLDLVILAKTIWEVFRAEGAY